MMREERQDREGQDEDQVDGDADASGARPEDAPAGVDADDLLCGECDEEEEVIQEDCLLCDGYFFINFSHAVYLNPHNNNI